MKEIKTDDSIKIFALGGLDENGKNLYVVEIDQDIYVIDAGFKYPNENEQLGVEMIIPDVSYLIKNKERVKAIFITKADDDNIRTLPYIMKEVKAPIYTTSLICKLVKGLLEVNKIKNCKINTIKRNDIFYVGRTQIESFAMTQSMPDGIGIAIKTEYGAIVYTSEFVIDYDNNNDHFSCDIGKIAQIGKNGVFALLTESRACTNEGYTSPKHKITNLVEHYFENVQGRLFVTLYQQNIYRLIEIFELAKKYDMKVYFHNNKQLRLLELISHLGYYKLAKELLISKEEFAEAKGHVLGIVSGTGSRTFKRMHKIALREDEVIQLRESDTVIIASPPSFETEVASANMENDLYKEHVHVVALKPTEVLSMHASKEDVKMIINILKPKYYFPVNGDYRHLMENAKTANSLGYNGQNIIVLDNGQIAQFRQGKFKESRVFLDLEEHMIDGNEKLDVGGLVLRDREILSSDGVIVLGVVINNKTKKLVAGPDIQSRGVIYLKDADHIIKKLTSILIDEIQKATETKSYENATVRLNARDKMAKYILKETGKRPMILPAIIEISGV